MLFRSAGGLSVYFNYLSYIKNLSDAATAPTARELFTNTDEMKQNATDGFTGAMAVVEGVGAVKMGPGLSNGTHFARVPRSPRAALNRAGAGVRRAGAGLAAAPGRVGRGIANMFRGGMDGLMRLRDRLRAFARRGDRPPMRSDIPADVPIRTPRDGNLGNFDGQPVRAEVDLPGSETMRVLDDGRCVVCASPCRHVSQNFGPELANNPRLAQRLERIERSLARNPNQPRVIQAHRDIQLQLREARIHRPARMRADFADELSANPALSRQLDDLEVRLQRKPANRRLQRQIDAIERRLDGAKRDRLRTDFGEELAHNPNVARQLDELPSGQSSRQRINDIQNELRGTRADRATAAEIRDIMRSPQMRHARTTFLRRGSHRRARQRAWQRYMRANPNPATRRLNRTQYFRNYDNLQWSRIRGGHVEDLWQRMRGGTQQVTHTGRWPNGRRWTRYIDNQNGRFIRELKSGRLHNNAFTRRQIVKDLRISRRTGMRPVWVLLEGADPSILAMLNRHGFRVVIP